MFVPTSLQQSQGGALSKKKAKQPAAAVPSATCAPLSPGLSTPLHLQSADNQTSCGTTSTNHPLNVQKKALNSKALLEGSSDARQGPEPFNHAHVSNVSPSVVAEQATGNVKQRSFEQRAASDGEPACVVCGKYGEYICDETDEDVCSLECKAVVLERAGLAPARRELSAATAFGPADWAAEDTTEQAQSGPRKEWLVIGKGPRLTEAQAEHIRKDLQLTVKGKNVPHPVLEFCHCPLPPRLLQNLEAAGYELPTAIQMQVIPCALAGRDVLACAPTGSGKTAAFLAPMLARLTTTLRQRALQGEPLAVILEPTRELCTQVEDQTMALALGLPQLRTALVVGGNPLPPQVHRLKQGAQVIVATPGRLVDVLTKHPEVSLESVGVLVLDEVDAMLALGFRDQVMQIVQALPQQRQTLLFSATLPPATEAVANSILQQPVRVTVGTPSAPSPAVQQTVIWVENKDKKSKLFAILEDPRHFRPPALVFVDSKVGADLLAGAVRARFQLKVGALHGDKPMAERRSTLQAFLKGDFDLLVATAVLGRGLDLLRVTQVIIFDMPQSLDEYIHQVGRAGRLGSPGTAMVFINDDSRRLFAAFVKLLHASRVVVPKQLANSAFAHSEYAAAAVKKQKIR